MEDSGIKAAFFSGIIPECLIYMKKMQYLYLKKANLYLSFIHTFITVCYSIFVDALVCIQ